MSQQPIPTPAAAPVIHPPKPAPKAEEKVAEKAKAAEEEKKKKRGGGRGGTILTSGVGLAGEPETRRKSLLGA